MGGGAGSRPVKAAVSGQNLPRKGGGVRDEGRNRAVEKSFVNEKDFSPVNIKGPCTSCRVSGGGKGGED